MKRQTATTVRNFFATVYKSIYYLFKTKAAVKFPDEGNTAVIHMGKRLLSQSNARFAFILCKYAELAGYRVAVKTDRQFYTSLLRYKKLLLKQPYQFVRSVSSPENSIVLYFKNGSTQINLHNCFKVQTLEKYDCVVPFTMHPSIVSKFMTTDFGSIRSNNRTIRIFFSGNVEQVKYSRKALETEYNVVSRFRSVNYLAETFGPTNNVEVITDRKVLYRLLTTEKQDKKIVISKVKTEISDWLRFLSHSEFFLALPGVEYPWCHNLIESMSVGTIPILQYAHMFYPALEPGKNCLHYTGLDELGTAVKHALDMTPAEVQQMRKNVIDYYENVLSPAIVIRSLQLKKGGGANRTVDVAIPFLKP